MIGPGRVLTALLEPLAGSSATVGTTSGPTPSITTSAWPSSRDMTAGEPVDHDALLGRLDQVGE